MKTRNLRGAALFFTLILALSVVLVGCSNPQKGKITVNFGTQTYPEIIIAQVKGFFEEELAPLNATVKIAVFQSGPPEVEALAAKSLDFAALGDQPALQAVSSGIPVKIISGIMDGLDGIGLVAREDSGIKLVKDIKGKKIAAPAGTNAYLLLISYLENEGLTFDDFEYVNLAIGSITPSLITGDIDGAVAFGATFYDPPEGERLVKVQNCEGYKRNINVILARNEFTKKHPEITVAILRAIQKAAKWRVDNFEESIDIITEWTGSEREAIIKLLDIYVTVLNLDQIALDAFSNAADLSYRNDIIQAKLTTEQLFDLKFQEQAGLEIYPGWGADKVSKLTN